MTYKLRLQKNLCSQNKWLTPKWYVQGLAPSWQACIPLVILILMVWSYAAVAQSTASPQAEQMMKELKIAVDTMWVLFTAFLVFFMNAGFCMLETGLCRHKNAVNLLAKNLIVFALSTISYWAIGFGLMFGDGTAFFGTNGWFLSGVDNSPMSGNAYNGVFHALSWAGIPLAAKFLFQLVFAGTAATIVSGAVAERLKFISFLLFSLLLTGIAYPIVGHWIWGKGWLSAVGSGFWDFSGSTVVHSVGGWSALVGAVLLGPRLGRYKKGGGATAMPGHNMSIATLGALILWLGWFGFNPGSTLAADPLAISHIAVATNTSAACGSLAATITSWLYFGKPDLSMIINGVLAGLVAITASCAFVNIPCAAIIGLIAGIIIVFSVVWVDRFEIDDPVGAISVHLVNGIWGTLAVGLFSVGPGVYPWYSTGPTAGLLLGGGFGQLGVQLLGVVAVALFVVVFSLLAWSSIKALVGLRVSAEEEIAGLDAGEHGMEAYPGFTKESERIPGNF